MKKFTALGAILIIAVFLFFQFTQQAAAEQAIQPAPPTDAHQLALNALSEQYAESETKAQQQALEEKMSPLNYKLSVQATAAAQPPKTLKEICADRIFLDQPKAEKPSGIQSVRPDFLATLDYQIENMWRGSYNSLAVEVYAGSRINDPGSGIIILSIPDLEIFTTFTDPNPAGSLRIKSEADLRLTLSSEQGQTRYFDIPAQQFTGDTKTALPAADLPPLPTPIFDPCAQFDEK